MKHKKILVLLSFAMILFVGVFIVATWEEPNHTDIDTSPGEPRLTLSPLLDKLQEGKTMLEALRELTTE